MGPATVKNSHYTNGNLHKVEKKAGLFDLFYNDIAIDLGTANTLISSKRHGIVFREPSIVAFNNQGTPVSFGQKAWLMHEKTHKNIHTVRPLRDGVIADFEAAEHMIRGMIKSVKRKWYSTTRQIVICVPSGITDVEKRAGQCRKCGCERGLPGRRTDVCCHWGGLERARQGIRLWI